MGLFDKFKKQAAKIEFASEHEAVVGVFLSSIAADGDVSDEEINQLAMLATDRPFFIGQDIAVLYRKAFEVLKSVDFNVLNMLDSAVGYIDPERYESVFTNSVDFVLADGVVDDEEQEVINKLQHLFGISDSRAQTIVDILITKNNL